MVGQVLGPERRDEMRVNIDAVCAHVRFLVLEAIGARFGPAITSP